MQSLAASLQEVCDELRQRTKFSIVMSCLAMLSVSLWGALHLDIPPKRRSRLQSVGIRLIWAGIKLVVPQLLLATALGQLASAYRLRKQVNAHIDPDRAMIRQPWSGRLLAWTVSSVPEQDEREKEDVSKLKHEGDKPGHQEYGESAREGVQDILAPHRWMLAHGFFAGMGGFAFHDERGQLCILTAEGVKSVIDDRPDLLAKMTVRASLILSQHNSLRHRLAKIAVLSQMAWFITSLVLRFSRGLPMTLMELTVMGYALIASCSLGLWWYKPPCTTPLAIIPHPGQRWIEWHGHELSNLVKTHGDIMDMAILDLTKFIGVCVSWVSVLRGQSLSLWGKNITSFPTPSEGKLCYTAVLLFSYGPVLSLALIDFILFVKDRVHWHGERLRGMLRVIGTVSVVGFVGGYVLSFMFLFGESIKELYFLSPNSDIFRTATYA